MCYCIFFQGLIDMKKPPEMISGNMTAGWKNLSVLKGTWNALLFLAIAYIVFMHILSLCWFCSYVRLFSIVHEICMDGSTAKLSASFLQCIQWNLTTLIPIVACFFQLLHYEFCFSIFIMSKHELMDFCFVLNRYPAIISMLNKRVQDCWFRNSFICHMIGWFVLWLWWKRLKQSFKTPIRELLEWSSSSFVSVT